ncbi:MAG: hypothetical protein WC495_04155 [Patescibacteria group bacterium]|jgi:hypothetical protein
MKHLFILASLLIAILTVSQGCIEGVLDSNEYAAVNLTLIGRTSGTPLSATIVTSNPSHSYSTNGDGFARLYAKYGQDNLQVTITYWTLPPSVQRTKTVTFRLSNKAVDQRLVLEDDPYRQ